MSEGSSSIMSSNSMANPVPLFHSSKLRVWATSATEEVICIMLRCLLAVYVVLLLCAMTLFGQFQEYII